MPKKIVPRRALSRTQMERVREIHFWIQRFTKNPKNTHFRVTDEILAREMNVAYPTLPSDRKNLKVSMRQIQRDRRVLEEEITKSEGRRAWEFEEPALVYDPKLRSWRYTREVDLSGFLGRLCDEKLSALLVAQKALAVFTGMPLANQVKEIFEEDAGGLVKNRFSALQQEVTELVSFHPDGAAKLDSQVFATLFRAALEQREVMITYRGKEDEGPRERRIHPYRLECFRQQWRLHALDAEKSERRVFVVTPGRMLSARLTDRHFKRTEKAESAPARRERGSTEKFVLRFAKRAQHYVLERQWS